MVCALQFETRASTGLFILAGTAESPCPWREWPAVINGRAHHAVTDTSPTLEHSPLYPPLFPSIFHSPTLYYLRSYLSTSVPRTISASNNNPVRYTSQNHKAPHGPLPLPPFHRHITSIHHQQFRLTTPTPTQANSQTDRIHSLHPDATSHFLDPSRTANLPIVLPLESAMPFIYLPWQWSLSGPVSYVLKCISPFRIGFIVL